MTMTTIIQKLDQKLNVELRKADEIWIAVALITKDGLNFILENTPKSCRQNYLIGTDLPTDPKALKTLYDLGITDDFNVRYYSRNKYYHPKVYLTKEKNRYTAFLGSANCTLGGIKNNIEISVKLDDQKSCNDLLAWFESLQKDSKPLESSFLDDYTIAYQTRVKIKREDEKVANQVKDKFNEEFEATFKKQSELLRFLSKNREGKNYHQVKRERDNVVKELRVSLDYPDFNDINIDHFFQIWELGHIIEIHKPKIKLKIKKFKLLLSMICDESIDIATRYDKALKGKYKIKFVSEGIITKVLTVHDPENYFVKNDMSDAALKKYGVNIPKSLSKGQKYKATAKLLKKICKETKIGNLAILDHYLYLEGSKKE